MRINLSAVRRAAYLTRPTMFKVAVEPLNPQPLTSSKPLPAIAAKCGVGWAAYSPLPKGIVVHQICAMPLQVGRQKRDHRTISAERMSAPRRWKVEPNYNPRLRDHRTPEMVNAL
jgi:hypothetical protein